MKSLLKRLDRFSIGTTQIHCPVPKSHSIKWDSLQLERDLAKLLPYKKSEVVFNTNATQVFPVCKLHNAEYTLNTARNVDAKLSYTYELSVCTATQRTSREKLVEWIEYHLLQGM